MDMIKFARFISYLTATLGSGQQIDNYQIEEIVGHIENLIASPNQINLQPMFAAMLAGLKIEAIREYRALTGCGLKNSKEAIETITDKLGELAVLKTEWRQEQQNVADGSDAHTLGDILNTAVNR